jgi:hypothetical protein
MLCPQCRRDNKAGAQFCGFCGSPLPASLTTVADTEVRTVVDTGARHAAEPYPGRKTVAPATSSTTRWLCAGVTLDPVLRQQVFDHVLEEQQRAVVTTPGVDLTIVLRYALAAHRRQVIAEGILLADFFLLIVTTFFVRSLVLFLLLIVVAWITVFVQRYVSWYGAVISGLQPGNFKPESAYSPAASSFAGRQLARIKAVGATGNLTLYSGFPPFRGYGTTRSSWSFAVDLTRSPTSLSRPGNRGYPKKFSALDVYDYVKAGLRELDLPGLELSDRLFVNGRDIHGDSRFLPDPGRPPVTSIDAGLMRQMLAEPEEFARPYLAISMTAWRGDLVMTSFVRFLVSGTDLFVEAAHTVVPPLRPEFSAIDERESAPDPGEFFGLAAQSLIGTIPGLLGSVPRILHEMGADGRRDKKQRRVMRTRDYGALVSVRELAADTKWQRYFQIFDDERFVKVIEQRLLRSLIDFLKEHDVDTSSLETRADMLINNGVMFGDNANVKDSQVAGAGSRLSGLMPRARAKEGGEAAS